MYMKCPMIRRIPLSAWMEAIPAAGRCKGVPPNAFRQWTESRFGVRQKRYMQYFALAEPLGDAPHVSVREHKIVNDWAEEIKCFSDVMYPDAEKIIIFLK
ncbi:hypothetical protein AALA98_04530 [Lachnospiraceae bacterium 45-W7]